MSQLALHARVRHHTKCDAAPTRHRAIYKPPNWPESQSGRQKGEGRCERAAMDRDSGGKRGRTQWHGSERGRPSRSRQGHNLCCHMWRSPLPPRSLRLMRHPLEGLHQEEGRHKYIPLAKQMIAVSLCDLLQPRLQFGKTGRRDVKQCQDLFKPAAKYSHMQSLKKFTLLIVIHLR